MKRVLRAILLSVVLFAPLPLQARAAENLIPVGEIIGLQLRNDTITVAAYDDVLGANARAAGLKIGDEIVKIGDVPVTCAEDVQSALHGQQRAALTVRRGSKLDTLDVLLEQTQDGPRLGVFLRQGIAGIGTVTFYDPDSGKFGTLGHGVSDAKGCLLQMVRGNAYEAAILSVKKGTCGDPGQLKGSAESAEVFGTLIRNTPQGVFGITNRGWQGERMSTADYEEITAGPAQIRCQVTDGPPREYSVEIVKIYPQARTDCRNFLLRVTDTDLLEITGGIVQGMGVSYNRDNQGKPLACNGFWCCPYFPLVTEIVAHYAQMCRTESFEAADHSGE